MWVFDELSLKLTGHPASIFSNDATYSNGLRWVSREFCLLIVD